MRAKKILIVSTSVILILIIAFFALRNVALHWAFEKVQQKIKGKYLVQLSAEQLSFSGLNQVDCSSISLVPDNSDTLLAIHHASFDVALSDLIFGKIGFNQIEIVKFSVRIFNTKEHSNISFYKNKSITSDTLSTETTESKGYREMLDGGLKKVFRLLRTEFYLRDFSLSYIDSLRNEQLIIPEIKYDLEKFNGSLIKLNEDGNDTLLFAANVIENKKKYSFLVEDHSLKNNYLPFLNTDTLLKARFKNIEGTIEFDDADVYKITTNVSLTDFHINHWRIAKTDVVFPEVNFSGLISVNEDAVEVDSSSSIKMFRTPFSFYVLHQRKPNPVFSLKIKMPEINSDSFFSSLPEGMFTTLKGIKTTGTLSYHLDFNIDKRNPDSLFFESGLNKRNFRIQHFGAENYSRIDTSFVFEAMDGDRKVRDIIVGPENPVFTPFSEISPFLKNAVMTSEDGSFMYNSGFNEEAFRESIVTNFKQKRFAKGGSTISMQLVKNCFLSRNKTVSRKVEEAMIVWLINNCGLVRKERMLEVYLNIIEWGPDVYGIGEASGFYFGKKPSELTLAESIYLSSIIPNPKFFKYEFDKEGNLKPYLSNYYRFMCNRMLSKEWIMPEDTVGLQPTVKLIGPAKQFVIPVDTIFPTDSLQLIQDEMDLLN